MLTKSDYIRYHQCPKYLWLYQNRKDILPVDIPEPQRHIFEQGYEVESYARTLFAEGVVVTDDIFKSREDTQNLIKEGKTTLFQATALSGDLLARADILKYDKDSKSWDIYEVKSTTEVKKEHIYDLAFQKIVFETDGFKIGKTYLVFLNNKYDRKGEIEPEKLLKIEDITDQVSELESTVKLDIPSALKILKTHTKPEVKILKKCDNPYECPFKEYCWQNIPKNSVYDLNRITEKKLNTLFDLGVFNIKDVPNDFELTEKQNNQVAVAKTGIPIIDKAQISSILSNLIYPIYFLDYETFSPAIPLFDGTHPYQQVPFQYSLHILKDANSKPEHKKFLYTGKDNPVPKLLEQLKPDIGATGSVIVWHKLFEMERNSEMGKMFPEYAEFLEDINSRVFDLKEIFEDQHYVDENFAGSCSIKNVLPVLIPELSYKDLEIQEGTMASLSWYKMNFETDSEEEKNKIKEAMLKYCELDTLAMVKIFKKLND